MVIGYDTAFALCSGRNFKLGFFFSLTRVRGIPCCAMCMCPSVPQTFYIRRHPVVRDCSITVWFGFNCGGQCPSLRLSSSRVLRVDRHPPAYSIYTVRTAGFRGVILTPRRYRYVANTVSSHTVLWRKLKPFCLMTSYTVMP